MEKSSPFTIYLFDKAKENIHIKLPIHLRYHSPANRKRYSCGYLNYSKNIKPCPSLSFKTIPLVEPTLYFSCSSDLYERKTNTTYQLPCRNASSIDNVYELPNAASCDWFDVDFIFVRFASFDSQIKLPFDKFSLFQNFEGPTSISVPVGNQALGVPVFIITLLVAWSAAAYLIYAVLKQKKKISKKVS